VLQLERLHVEALDAKEARDRLHDDGEGVLDDEQAVGELPNVHDRLVADDCNGRKLIGRQNTVTTY
jgi:hypothetical protein